jgi:hypothetical protein
VVRFCIDRFWGTVMGSAGGSVSREFEKEDRGSLLSPETFLIKICIVSAGSGETEREAGDEERILSYL